MNDMDDIYKLIYLAGIIDGEGTIGIGRQMLPNNNYTYRQHLIIGNTDIRLIEWLVENFGGKFPKAVNSNEKWKDSYMWQLTGTKSYKLLKKVRPYLLLKQEQADNAIELWEKVSNYVYSRSHKRPEYRTELSEELYHMCRELNKKGKHDEESEPPRLLRKNIKVTETLEEYM